MDKLTRDQILAMPVGRELDVLVDNNVMNRFETTEKHGEWVYPTPRSTDISAAWEAEAKALEKDTELYTHCLAQAVWNGDGVDYVRSGPGDNYLTEHLHELIHASPSDRCKAALLAVMADG